MATRRDIRESFYDELATAASNHLSQSDIGHEYPNSEEDLPTIVHDDNYRGAQARWNATSAPTNVVDNNDGTYDVQYSSMQQAVFQLLIASDDEQEKEDIYQDVFSYFEKFQYPRWDPSNIQTDIHDVSVEDTNSQDSQDRSPQLRGDLLTIQLGYERFITYTVSDINIINTELRDIETINGDGGFGVDFGVAFGQGTILDYTVT